MPVGIVACGALAGHVLDIVERNGIDARIETVDALLHVRPAGIPSEVEALLPRLLEECDPVALAYADCGTYGALDDICDRYGVTKLAGNHCYDVFATAERMKAEFEAVPGTFVLTDFMARTFKRTVMVELGLDRHPDLRDTYFGSYTRLLWLTQAETPELAAAAQEASELIGLPLERVHVGDIELERQLLALIGGER